LKLSLVIALSAACPEVAQQLVLNDQGYYEAPGVDVLSFANVNEGLFADAKISGIEVIQQDMRTAPTRRNRLVGIAR
jgi:endoglucanase